MNKFTLKIAALALFLGLAGCSSSPDDVEKVPDKSAQALYQDARSALDNGLYQKAIPILSAIDSRYPFGAISHQVQLDLLYAYYKSGDSAQGTALAERFLRLNPNHKNVDYVHYIRGLINQSLEENLFQEMAGIDRSDRDPQHARAAFNDFRTILTQYPESKYAKDAHQRMLAIKSRLADYELSAARFFMKRKAYAAAANRGRYIVEYFGPGPQVEFALEIMIEAYGKLGLTDLQTNARQVMTLNYPNNPNVKGL
ncbi:MULTISPECIES: outer membrane protein assembly factor BamD [unclassified Thalassotalea]|uniref:outer membrane protein assembly factor BamD n=1 Tax=unclassified Thalassotalea TaxID=2614972 RepID=UPI0010808D1F|nr:MULTISPECIES: outer membrane protein assembly factor BamD [unclassified Thalassotalea]NMP17260.1 outer membrane protein assembly factor BamD [Thalassotalea sp. Y01]QBY05275.1 outer membrane protein assembly factor BamD [Thalassotalea sp. HSM 43]